MGSSIYLLGSFTFACELAACLCVCDIILYTTMEAKIGRVIQSILGYRANMRPARTKVPVSQNEHKI